MSWFKNKRIQTQKGFTLVLSIVIAALVLSIGISILNITIKEQVLTASGRDSQIAFNAADSGMECVLYWDLKDTVVNPFDTYNVGPDITCNGGSVTQTIQDFGGSNIARESTVDLSPAPGCVTVTITKIAGQTTIRSRGHNTCVASDPRRIERGIQTTYTSS